MVEDDFRPYFCDHQVYMYVFLPFTQDNDQSTVKTLSFIIYFYL